MTEIIPKVEDDLPMRIIPRVGKDAVGAMSAPANPYDVLLDPEAMDPAGLADDAAVRPAEKPKDEVEAWVGRSTTATKNALKASGGTETAYFNIPPKE